MASHGTRSAGGEAKTYTTRASTRAAPHPNKRSQTVQPDTPKSTQAPRTSTPQTGSSAKENQAEIAVVVHKEVLNAFGLIADRLDQILEKCKTTEHFTKAITSLAKFTREAAEYEHESVIQLMDVKAVKSEITADLSNWCKTIEDKLDNLGGKQNEILEATANFSERATGLQSVAKELEGQITKVTVASDKIASNVTPYRDALLGGNGRDNRDAVDERVIIDLERKAKQIMIVIKDFESSTVTPDELAVKANGIIANIKDYDRPEEVKIDNITKFLNGGLLLQLNSKEATKWLRQPEIEEAFLSKLAKDAYVKERPHNVLLRGVPIIFDPSSVTHLREIEETNNLPKYSLLKARWIKPEGRRRRGQTHAHATAAIALVETANKLIKEGLEICGVRIRPEKLKQEPIQCLRCRRWGHFATNCQEPNDTCGTCGEAHRTNLCKNTERKHCVSCRTNSHTSWDRECPEFIRRCKLYDENHPENKMVYFPTDEAWTLTTRPDRIPIEERFPQRFAVNSIPVTIKKPHARNKRTMPTKHITANNAQGKEQQTINHYFSSSQANGKGKEPVQGIGEPQDEDELEYEDCFNNLDNNDVERLLGSPLLH
jgi:hypothetical protein